MSNTTAANSSFTHRKIMFQNNSFTKYKANNEIILLKPSKSKHSQMRLGGLFK